MYYIEQQKLGSELYGKKGETTHMNKLRESRTKAVMPVRVCRSREGRDEKLLLCCSYDISKGGALLGGIRGGLPVGEIVTLERMGNKARFQVCSNGKDDMVGLHCLQPELDIWGIGSIPPPPKVAAQRPRRFRWLS